MDTQGKYMVSVTGLSAPKVRHLTFMEAVKEAERLSNCPGNAKREILVLQVIAELKPTKTHEWIT